MTIQRHLRVNTLVKIHREYGILEYRLLAIFRELVPADLTQAEWPGLTLGLAGVYLRVGLRLLRRTSCHRQPKFSYGGQAVIEGIMIRGRSHFSLAVRREDGTISHIQEPLNTLFTGKVRRVPLLRGFLALVETLALGIKALHQSANMAMVDQTPEGEKEMSGWVLGGTLGISLLLGVGIFFVHPPADCYPDSPLPAE